MDTWGAKDSEYAVPVEGCRRCQCQVTGLEEAQRGEAAFKGL